MDSVEQATFRDVLRESAGLKAEVLRRRPLGDKVRLAVDIATTTHLVRRSLRRLDLPAVLERLREDAPESPPSAAAAASEHLTALRLGIAVRKTLRVLPGDTRCLTQSLVLTRLLARRGIGTKLLIAVTPGEDFAAHAWLHHGGEPILPADSPGFAHLVEL